MAAEEIEECSLLGKSILEKKLIGIKECSVLPSASCLLVWASKRSPGTLIRICQWNGGDKGPLEGDDEKEETF